MKQAGLGLILAISSLTCGPLQFGSCWGDGPQMNPMTSDQWKRPVFIPHSESVPEARRTNEWARQKTGEVASLIKWRP